MKAIDCFCCQVGRGDVMSSTYDVDADETPVISGPPAVPIPDVSTFPGKYITALPPSTATGSIVVQVCVATFRARATTLSSYEPVTSRFPLGNTNACG